MIPFEVLVVVGVLVATLGILRLRPVTFILGANQVLALRAFINIRDYGQPASQEFLPPQLFRAENLETAANIFAIFTGLLLVSALSGSWRREEPERAQVTPVALPTWLLWGLVLYFLAMILSSRTIFEFEYTDPQRTLYGFKMGGGVYIFAIAWTLYELYRRVVMGRLSPWQAFGIVLLLCTLTEFVKGSTGLAAGILPTSAILLLGADRSRARRLIGIGVAVLLIGVVSLTIRGARTSLHSGGSTALSEIVDAVVKDDEKRRSSGEGAERYANATQTACHILQCVELYDDGVSREWRSVWAPLEYTFKPAFLVELLELERSKEAAWELGDYYIHGGGINTLGELYWNGGYTCVAIVAAFLVLWAHLCDTRYRSRFRWLLMTANFAPGLYQGFGYGFAQVSRGVFNGLLMLACFGVLVAVLRVREQARKRPLVALPGPARARAQVPGAPPAGLPAPGAPEP